jgi:hypothetical protein
VKLCALLIGWVALLPAPPALAQAREASLDHSGSLGLLVGVAPEWGTFELSACPTCEVDRVLGGYSALLDLGGTMAVGQEGSELALRLRLTLLSALRGAAVQFGYRHFFGRDAFKTYFSFDLRSDLAPALTVGARAGFGAMFELSPLVGLYAEPGASFGIGQGRRFGAEFFVGAQFRSFLLE